jgi:hypothetical protein
MYETVVFDNHTLGVVMGESLQILHADVLRGASTPTRGLIPLVRERCRPATLQDFEAFRVAYHPDYKVTTIG